MTRQSNLHDEPMPGPRSEAKDTPAVSLVLATYGRIFEVELMIRSLLRQTDSNFELIVVDQNLDDRVSPLLSPLRSVGIFVNHIRLETPNGSGARNVGIANARAALVGFPDDDCWYEDDVVERVRDYFARQPDSDGVVGCWAEWNGRKIPAHRLSLDVWRQFKNWDAPCFALFFRTARLRSFGQFDERIGPGSLYASAEDIDLMLRSLEQGGRIDYVPEIVIHHPFAPQPPLTLRQCRRDRLYGRGTGALLVKHRLPPWAFAKGLIAPIARALMAPRPFSALVLGTLTVFGRLEGMAAWLVRHTSLGRPS